METVRRGYEPKDVVEFGPGAAEKMNAAAWEIVFLTVDSWGMTPNPPAPLWGTTICFQRGSERPWRGLRPPGPRWRNGSGNG